MSNHNVPISLEMQLDDQVSQSDSFMTFDIALKSHVANPQDIESGNILTWAPNSSHTNQELATFGVTTSSHGSKAGDLKLPAIKGAPATIEILKALRKQVKF
jgi:hypothetical protein